MRCRTGQPNSRPTGQHIYLVAPLRRATQSQAALLPEYNPDFVHLVALLRRATHNQAAPLPEIQYPSHCTAPLPKLMNNI
jgi:hypothetical protein